MGLHYAYRGYVESICPRGLIGLLSKTQDEVCEFFEKFIWDTYAFEQAKKNFRFPTHGETVFHVNPSHQDYFMNSYDPFQSNVSPILYDYYESSYHDAYNCPYRAYVDATCASVEKING